MVTGLLGRVGVRSAIVGTRRSRCVLVLAATLVASVVATPASGPVGAASDEVPDRLSKPVAETRVPGFRAAWSMPTGTASSDVRSVTVQARHVPGPIRISTETRIVGGSGIDIEDVPWQVLMYVQDSFLCGGTLINRRWVLTAAHCATDDSEDARPFDASEFEVWAGITRRTETAQMDPLVVDRVVVHPDWDHESFRNDLALLHLERPASAGTPIRLYSTRSGPDIGMPAFVSGWGVRRPGAETVPDRLRGAAIEVRASPGDSCGRYGRGFDPSSMLCAGEPAGDQDTCQGDSGGPLVVPNGNTWELAGITSWGRTCAAVGYPGIYTRVSSFVRWIYSVLGWETVRTVSCLRSDCESARVRSLSGGWHAVRVAAVSAAGRGPWSRPSHPVRAG